MVKIEQNSNFIRIRKFSRRLLEPYCLVAQRCNWGRLVSTLHAATICPKITPTQPKLLVQIVSNVQVKPFLKVIAAILNYLPSLFAHFNFRAYKLWIFSQIIDVELLPILSVYFLSFGKQPDFWAVIKDFKNKNLSKIPFYQQQWPLAVELQCFSVQLPVCLVGANE